ncbi:KPN_02809 family neutral zinc metallopeptidase [Cellulosimicrobium marinum]|uniref:KPN_02809 family neutral zinc metallopeptidase n=1 Tax=Cellulosimicrobium marinum TaxID=1638992 RepID=UPI001E387F18|nr:neutral zinc metallopeptidase [Cellulosimicrobium marinum]MCB7137281.1 neutral zinc metallopeptidase [Cellulosimicrobium marinum]
MTFQEGGSFEGGRVRKGAGRGRRGPVIAGGGIGAVLVVLAVVLLSGRSDVDLGALTGDGGGTSSDALGEGQAQYVDDCSAEQANTELECELSATAQALDAYWDEALPAQAGVAYELPDVVSFSGQVSTGCGAATSAVGPFYCPGDRTVYIDVGFYDDLTSRFGANDGGLARMYVVAHEFGHHVEQLVGAMDAADRQGTGPDSDAVRIELMADCLAGMWAGDAASTVDPDTGVTFLEPITEQQLADALSAASAVGDDRIQEAATGRVNPEAWTHGSSEQRQRWFMTGYDGGTLADCDALSAATL